VLKVADVAAPISAGLYGGSSFPWTNLRGVRSGPEFCARAQMLSETPIAAAIVPLEILRSFEFIQLIGEILLFQDFRLAVWRNDVL
jgi:hypothetical protein